MSKTFGRSIQRGQYPVRVKGDSKCVSHMRNKVDFLCNNCHVLVCVECSTTTHKSHSILEINRILKDQKKKLHYLVNHTVGVQIPKLKQEIVTAKEELENCQPEYETLSDRIKKRRDQCKLDLDKIAEEYLVICHNMMDASKDLMQTHITNLEERLTTLEKLSSECKKTLQTGTAVLLYDSVSEMQTMDFEISETPRVDKMEFPTDQDRLSYLKQAMGKMDSPDEHLQVGSANGGHPDQSPVGRPQKFTEIGQDSTGAILYKLSDSSTVTSQFSYPDTITSICPTSDGRAWLCDFDTNTVNLINNKGHIIQTIQHTNNISDISLDPTTDRLWFCCRKDRTIYELSISSTPVKRFTSEGCPTTLCVTKEGRVVAGTAGRQGYKAVMYTADGLMLHTAIVDRLEAGFVWSITQCAVTGNIAVVSCKHSGEDNTPNKYRRHVIVYNQTLEPLFHYRGEGMQTRDAVTADKFGPITIVYDSKGNIVIADCTKNTIELVSGAGKYIKTLHQNKGQGPVGIQKGDVLWSYLVLDTGVTGVKLHNYYSD